MHFFVHRLNYSFNSSEWKAEKRCLILVLFQPGCFKSDCRILQFFSVSHCFQHQVTPKKYHFCKIMSPFINTHNSNSFLKVACFWKQFHHLSYLSLKQAFLCEKFTWYGLSLQIHCSYVLVYGSFYVNSCLVMQSVISATPNTLNLPD